MERKLKFGRVVCQDVRRNWEKRGREVRRITFKYDVPLEETMEFETVYHPKPATGSCRQEGNLGNAGGVFCLDVCGRTACGRVLWDSTGEPDGFSGKPAGLAGARGGKSSLLLFEYDSAGVPEAGTGVYLEGALAGPGGGQGI